MKDKVHQNEPLIIAEVDLSTLRLGDFVSFTHRFTDGDLEIFTRLSGDINPVHWDDEYAQSLGFKERLVFGLLTSALVSRLVGVHLPGRYSLIREVQMQFPNPLYRGEEIEMKGVVDFLNLPKRLLAIKVAAVRTADGKKVMRGKVHVIIPDTEGSWRLSAEKSPESVQ